MPATSLTVVEQQIDEHLSRLQSLWQANLNKLAADETRISEIVIQSAPLAASLGVWLQGLSAPGVFEDQNMLACLSLLADDFGGGTALHSRKDCFETLGKHLGIRDYSTQSHHLITRPEIGDAMYCFPSLLLMLSRRSDAFIPELIGIDYIMRSMGIVPAWQALKAACPQHDLGFLDLSLPLTQEIPDQQSPVDVSRQLITEFSRNPAHWQRIQAGFSIALHGLYQWHQALFKQLQSRQEPAFAMATLIQNKAQAAAVYHHDFPLEGKPLSDWFEDAVTDPIPLLNVLARSRLIRPGKPEKSPLIQQLIQYGGPMFRIFDDAEVQVIRRWILSLPATKTPETGLHASLGFAAEALTAHFKPSHHVTVAQGDEQQGLAPQSIRQAYHLLQGRALTPVLSAFVTDYIEFWLTRAAGSLDQTPRSLPRIYQPGMLKTWLLSTHAQQSHAAGEMDDESIPERETVIEQTLQLAPLTLIDGSWLQGFTDIQLATSRYGARLFKTYWDELGNGMYAINHPKVYRDVLRAMAIELPATGSPAFAFDGRFRDASFYLPVYWLCLGKKAISYLPEILGMNLAMELSGVGGSYMNASRFLHHHGFPSTFVDLHNTIDNVSTGHSAWAAESIDDFMSQYLHQEAAETLWQRIRIGYESLAPIVKHADALNFFDHTTHPSNITDEKTQHGLLHHHELNRTPKAKEQVYA
ncbi:iron-containing redox enzyme family protein [Photobacterium sp. 1_MG-2023]|uniref:iron-containing redox enzyme family protein n=1 Tax=Photobacterium sp. 1_MG-2023 TaxID=3062646 RepID=UPI0026E211B5|nr:iron-containing redox enzyme family protein [Photobacterium sp. 1_MG-2023]MDO6705844.1 iron-containing redox enzyme family protein [Photobacterium sp. 1_MG-2023]